MWQYGVMSGDKRHNRTDRWLALATRTDARAIDELYGLEPLYEPQGGEGGAPDIIEFITVECPYCAECYDSRIDLSAGSFTYIEDCQICCQPIEMEVNVNAAGERARVTLRRSD